MSNLLLFQVRLGSSRFPRKPLYKLNESQPSLLEILIKRFLLHHESFANINFTPLFILPDSDEELAHKISYFGLPVFLGHEHPPIRFSEALSFFKPEYHVRICCDNPFMDYEYMLWFVRLFISLRVPYAQPYVKDKPSTLSQSGIAFEFINSMLLLDTQKSAYSALEDEHVTTILYNRRSTNPWKNLFPATDYFYRTDESASIRLTVDYPRDFALLERIYSVLGERIFSVPTREIIKLISLSPELSALSLQLSSLAAPK